MRDVGSFVQCCCPEVALAAECEGAIHGCGVEFLVKSGCCMLSISVYREAESFGSSVKAV